MNRKRFMMATLISVVLLTVFFIPLSGLGSTYDPWIDYNDDGAIDYDDFLAFAAAYLSTGTPINKTALLLELQERIDRLNASLHELNATKLGKPDYDSGWMSISKGQNLLLEHNLATTDVWVYVIGYSSVDGIHQNGIGGREPGEGLLWYDLDEDYITVYRRTNDPRWKEVRVMIWKIQ